MTPPAYGIAPQTREGKKAPHYFILDRHIQCVSIDCPKRPLRGNQHMSCLTGFIC